MSASSTASKVILELSNSMDMLRQKATKIRQLVFMHVHGMKIVIYNGLIIYCKDTGVNLVCAILVKKYFY